MVLDPVLPTKGLAMVHSARGIGKTHLALAIAYTVASGGSLLGWWAPEPRRVIYVDGEMPAATMQRRVAAIVAGFKGEPTAPHYLRLLSATSPRAGCRTSAPKMGRTRWMSRSAMPS